MRKPMSAAGKKNVSLAQKRRWAKWRKNGGVTPNGMKGATAAFAHLKAIKKILQEMASA